MLRRSFLTLTWLGGTASTPSLGTDVRNRHGQYVNLVAEGTQRRATAAHFSANPSTNAPLFLAPEVRSAVATRGMVGVPKAVSSKWNRALRADIYDELLKLPLRFALHDFAVLQRHLSNNLSTRRYITELQQQGGSDSTAARASSSGQQSGNGQAATAAPNAAGEGEEDSGVYLFNSGDDAEGAEGKAALAVGHRFYSVAGRVSAVGYAPPLGPADPLDVIPFFVHRTSNGQLPGTLRSMHARNLMPAFVLMIENSVEGDLFRFEEELMKIFPTKKIFVRRHCVYVYNVGKDGRDVLHHWLLGLGF